jgi:hypothetical protein
MLKHVNSRQRARYIANLLRELRELADPIGDRVLEHLLCLSALIAEQDAKLKVPRHLR